MKAIPGTFTPLPDSAKIKYGLVGAAVFGEVLRYCLMPSGVCRASKETLAGNLAVSVRTMIRWLKVLCSGPEPYLRDLTPGLKNRPHHYKVTPQLAYDIDNGVPQRQTIIDAAMPERQTKEAQGMPEMQTEQPNGVTQRQTTMTEDQAGMTERHVGPDRESLDQTLKETNEQTKEETGNGVATPPPKEGTVPPIAIFVAPISEQEVANPDPELAKVWRTAILPELLASTGRFNGDTYLRPLRPICRRDGYVFIGAKDHIVDWCLSLWLKPLQRTVSGVLHEDVQVRLVRLGK